MAQRPLYIAAYDISDPRRLVRCLRVLRNYATGGQKSVFECYLSAAERQALLVEMGKAMNVGEDRFFLVRLDPRSRVQALGIAVPPFDLPFFYVG